MSRGCSLGLVRGEDEVPERGARGPLSPEQGRLWRPTPDVSPMRPRRKLSGWKCFSFRWSGLREVRALVYWENPHFSTEWKLVTPN